MHTTDSLRHRIVMLALAAVAFGLFLTGCAVKPWSKTPFPPPADVAHVRLSRGDSPSVIVDKIWLERRNGVLFVSGYVMAKVGVRDTMGSNLLVSLRDANGNELRSGTADFFPRQIPEHRRPSGVSRYSVQLDPLPAGFAEVLVSARDDRSRTASEDGRKR